MIRRYLVWFVVIVTALAAGIALGGGPLSDVGSTPSQAAAPEPTTTPDPLEESRADYSDSFAEAVGPDLYAGSLEGRSVAVLTLPGADPATVEALGDALVAAGGEVTGTYALRKPLVDPNEKSLVDTLGIQVVEQLGGDVAPSDASTYDRMGRLVGHAVSSRSEKSALPAAKVSSLRASLDGAGMLGLPDGDPAPASLVLVVAGDEVEAPVLSGLVAGLAATSAGLVVAGPTEDPSVAALRSDAPSRPVTTVDGTDLAAGLATTVLALGRSLDEPGGSYGASGSDGPAPLG